MWKLRKIKGKHQKERKNEMQSNSASWINLKKIICHSQKLRIKKRNDLKGELLSKFERHSVS